MKGRAAAGHLCVDVMARQFVDRPLVDLPQPFTRVGVRVPRCAVERYVHLGAAIAGRLEFARDIAVVIRNAGDGGPAIIVGHAFGSWVARMTAIDHPELVRGVVMVAAAAKAYPVGFPGAKELSEAVQKSGDFALPTSERLRYLRLAFFAPNSDPRAWLQGWHPAADEVQLAAGRATKQSEWWSGGGVPLLDLQGELDPFKPRTMSNEMRDEFGERVSVVVIPDASHAVIQEQPNAAAAAILAWIAKLPQ